MIRRTLRLLAILTLFVSAAVAQTTSDYNTLVQKGKTQLQAGTADLALASGEEAIKMNADRWEGYALGGGALMNLKRYEEAADKLSEAIKRAPEAKQAALRDLRRQCLVAESGASPAAKESAPAMTSQAEIVLWKSIENSTNPADFQSYLDQYPHGAFVVLAQRHLKDVQEQAEQQRQLQRELAQELAMDKTVWVVYPVMSGVPQSGEGEFWVFLNGEVYRNSFGILNDVVHPKHNHDSFAPVLADAKAVISGQQSIDWFKTKYLKTKGTYITSPPANVTITDTPNDDCKGPGRIWAGTIGHGEMAGSYSRQAGSLISGTLNPFTSSVSCSAETGTFKLQRLKN
jgi:tetratricopeptide (TPR) repeat protein